MWFAIWMTIWVYIWMFMCLYSQAHPGMSFMPALLLLWAISTGIYVYLMRKFGVLSPLKLAPPVQDGNLPEQDDAQSAQDAEVLPDKQKQWALADMVIFSLLSGFNVTIFSNMGLFSGTDAEDLSFIPAVWCLFVSLTCFQIRILLESENYCAAKAARIIAAVLNIAAIILSGLYITRID